MINIIKNNELKIEISDIGAELMSVTNNNGMQYIWNGDPEFWDRRAPNLFPYIGRLTNKSYYYKNKLYHMEIHGFLRDSKLQLTAHSDNRAVYELKSSDETLAVYPFPFALMIEYTLEGTKLVITYHIQNTGSETMYFGIGGHPGFNVPMEEGLQFEDYELDIGTESELVVITPDCYCTGELAPFSEADGKPLPLDHSLFDNDAIILKCPARLVRLYSRKGKHGITVDFPKMPYVGLWHRPKTTAPYLCIEPWTSLPSRKDIIEDISTQPDMIVLEVKDTYTNTWTIDFN